MEHRIGMFRKLVRIKVEMGEEGRFREEVGERKEVVVDGYEDEE